MLARRSRPSARMLWRDSRARCEEQEKENKSAPAQAAPAQATTVSLLPPVLTSAEANSTNATTNSTTTTTTAATTASLVFGTRAATAVPSPLAATPVPRPVFGQLPADNLNSTWSSPSQSAAEGKLSPSHSLSPPISPCQSPPPHSSSPPAVATTVATIAKSTTFNTKGTIPAASEGGTRRSCTSPTGSEEMVFVTLAAGTQVVRVPFPPLQWLNSRPCSSP